MVLAHSGIIISEVELRQLCDCTIYGTDAFQAVKAARKLGFTATRKQNLTLGQLDDCIAKGCYPIVYISLLPLDRMRDIHAVVVVESREETFVVLDPLIGERYIERSRFESAFRVKKGLTIMLAKE